MNISEIKNIIGGFQAPVHVKRQAWIEYGGLLCSCKSKDINVNGLDFIEPGNRRSLAKRIWRLYESGVNFNSCFKDSPSTIFQWSITRNKITTKNQRKDAGVYVAKSTDFSPVKIGFVTTYVEGRISSLSTSSHVRFKLSHFSLAEDIDVVNFENAVHRVLKQYRCENGEFFNVSEKVAIDAINQVKKIMKENP